MNNMVNEIAIEIGCQIERALAIQLILEDVIEEYSDCAMVIQSDELQKANLKLIALSGFLERELAGMNETVDKLSNIKMEDEKNDKAK